jgi:1-acyl-sn-glycerol-3-phosphate acyltransferase
MPGINFHIPLWRRWFARPFIRFVLRLIFRILSPVKIIGKNNVPLRSPYIIAINHVSLFEAPFIGAFWPEQFEAIGASDIWERPGQNTLAKLWGAIPVHRGDYDRKAIETILNALRSGHPVLIAPEGGRSHVPGMRQAKTGIAFLVEQTGVPVVPVGIIGTTDDYWHKASKGKRPKLEMRIGQPINFGNGPEVKKERKASRQEMTDLVMYNIAGLLPKEYRGYYISNASPTGKAK